MPTLGDMLGSARRRAGLFQDWVEAADPGFAEEVRAAADRSGESFAGFARAAVADFSRFADEEAWASLTRSVRDHDDPATACLVAMIRWRLAAVCGDHAVSQPSGG